MISKKTALIVLFLIFIFSFVSSYLIFSLNKEKIFSFSSSYQLPKNNNKALEEDNEPKTEECPINGAFYSKTQKEKWEKRRPLGVMIENHIEARPQSGLSSADVVFEAVAEGGITRFLGVFYCQDAPYIGPIRSARIYFIKMLQGFGNYPLYAHVGGANTPGPADALGEIRRLGWANYNDLNQFSIPFPYFWRDYERLSGRAIEHTVYSSTAKLWQYAKEKRNLTNIDEEGISWDKNYEKWSFKNDEKTELRGNVNKIDFGFWDNLASDFSVIWNYDKKSNYYLRMNGGKNHLDKNNGKQIKAKNVVIVFAKESPANDGYEGGHLLYGIIGKGEAIIFQNGKAIEGNWKKKDEETQMKFYDNNNKEIDFVRGPIWIEILPIGNKVVY
ncbi:MAG: DUF3048 domain-containing protein [Patescibacteria group bacterium]|nr:DUF3048 domain-containing protein [Patescibacteria group bacterium]